MSADSLAVDVMAWADGEVEVRPSGDGVLVTTDTHTGLALSVELSPGQAQRLARALRRAAALTVGEVL